MNKLTGKAANSRPADRRAREAERRRGNREAILHAAEGVIRRRGFTRLSMDDVAAAAQFSKPTLYRYFRSKGELIAELVLHYMEDVESGLASIARREAPPRDKLRDAVGFVFAYLAERESLTRLFVVDASFLRLVRAFVGSGRGPASGAGRSFARRIRERRRKVMAATESIVRQGIEAGDFRPDLDPGRVVLLMSAIIQGYFHETFWNDPKPDPERDVLDIYALILHGIATGNVPEGESS